MGLKPSPMAYICLGAGGIGAVAAMVMQWWMSAVDYPVRIGGKPFFSWPAFVPITFELFVLFASLATMGGMIVLCKLGSWASPLHDSGVMVEVTTTRHGVVLDADDPKFSEDDARALLESTGCDDIRPLYEAVSDEGFSVPSTTSPSTVSTTWSSGCRSSYITPLGLITTSPLSGSRALTLPAVHVTRPSAGSIRCSFHSSSFNVSSIRSPS